MKDVQVSELREDRATLIIVAETKDGHREGFPLSCVKTPDGWMIVDY